MIDSWFPTLILHKNLSSQFENDFNDKVYNMVKEIQKNYIARGEWRCDTYNTLGIDIKNLELFEDFLKVIKYHIITLSDLYKIDKKYNLVLKDLWINVAEPGEYQEYHNHRPHHFSAVYYVKTPKNCGNIVFRNLNSWANNIALDVVEYSNVSSDTCCYTPTSSLLLAFKSDLIHMVEKNKSDEDRVSIAMNFCFE